MDDAVQSIYMKFCSAFKTINQRLKWSALDISIPAKKKKKEQKEYEHKNRLENIFVSRMSFGVRVCAISI